MNTLHEILHQYETRSHNGLPGFISAQQTKQETILRMPQSEKELWDRQRVEHENFWSKLRRQP